MVKNSDEFRSNSRPFQSIEETVRSTGLSAFYLRQGIKSGTVPFVRSGKKYMVNVPKLLENLDALPTEQR